jgi:hypothetical protein
MCARVQLNLNATRNNSPAFIFQLQRHVIFRHKSKKSRESKYERPHINEEGIERHRPSSKELIEEFDVCQVAIFFV